jgi:oligoendopeptidase F
MYDNKFEQVDVASRSIPERADIEEKYKWSLTDVFKSDDDWESEFRSVLDRIPADKCYAGSASSLCNAFKRQ